MPFGRWELPQVDVVALEDVLGDGPVGDDRGWDGLDGIHPPLPLVHQVERRDVGGETQADRQAGPLTLGVGQHPVPGRITGNVVEQDRRCAIGVHEHFGDPADVLLPVDAVHHAQLAQRVDQLEPVAHVLVGHAAGAQSIGQLSPLRFAQLAAERARSGLRYRLRRRRTLELESHSTTTSSA